MPLLDLPGLFSGSKASWDVMSSTNAVSYLSLQSCMANAFFSGSGSWLILTPKLYPTVLGTLMLAQFGTIKWCILIVQTIIFPYLETLLGTF